MNARAYGAAVTAACAIAVALTACSAGPAVPSSTAGQPGTGSTATAVRTPSTGTAAGDLDLLLERLEATHPAPFHGVPRSVFVSALQDLQQRLPVLEGDEATVEVMRLVALLSRDGRDGHQFALPQPGHEGEVLPLRVYEFAEGLFVTAAMAPHTDLVGAEVTAIGSHPVSEVLARLEPLVPRDGPATVPAFRPIFLLRTQVLRGLGLIGAGPLEVTVRTPTGEVRQVMIDPVPFEAYTAWAGRFGMFQLPARHGVRYLGAGTDVLRAETMDGGAAYLRYAEVQAPGADAITAARTVLAAATGGVVLDLRQNPGGDNHNNPSMVSLLSEALERHPGAPMVVLTDRVTFSAAANLATDLERAVDPVYVGEAMGGGLNFWDDVTQVRLDHLPVPLQVGISTRYWERSAPDDPRLTITPDVETAVSAADYFAGRDVAMTAAAAVIGG